MESEKIILGIDPGTIVMGYAVIRQQGKQVEILRMGVLKLGRLDNQALKLKKTFERVLEIVSEYKPDELAIEAPFYGKNVQSMLKLGRAQGVAMAAALYRDIPIFEYAPRTIKQTITGNGSSSKQQVAKMLQHIIHFQEMPEFLDATDALAAAVCHWLDRGKDVNYTKHAAQKAKAAKKADWSSFIANNPDRVQR
ncbi:MAG: crossover junction endodeoxyribonuclease RuvC [Candidatus Limimorpha sp.]